MAYVKIIYQNSPSTATPINAENLNHMDDQIALNDQRLTEIETSYVKSFNGRKGDVTAQNGDYNIGQIAPLTGAQVGQVPVVVNVGTEEAPKLKFSMGAGGGGGHSIIDSEGNTMPQESAMQFADSFVSDDDVNGRTIIENVKELTLAELSQATERGMYLAKDEESVPIGEIEEDVVTVVGDGVKTWGTLLSELYNDVDFDKLTLSSQIELVVGSYKAMYYVQNISPSEYVFVNIGDRTTKVRTTTMVLSSTSSIYDVYEGTNDPLTNNSPANRTKITLHYGTSSGIVELNTDARHCMMSDGVTSVESAIDSKLNKSQIKVKTLTITTDNTNAVASTGLSTSNTIPLCVYCTGMVATIGSVYQNIWYVGLYDYGTGTPLKNTTKEITIYYIQN